MPPFVNTNCSNCSKPNRFDLSELSPEIESKDVREYIVACGYCGRKFKFSVSANLSGDGAIAQGQNAKAVGAGGILIEGGVVAGRDVVTGNRLAGDSSTDAPPPDVKKKRKRN